VFVNSSFVVISLYVSRHSYIFFVAELANVTVQTTD